MEIKIIEQKQNLLFPRREILAEITSKVNPKKFEVEELLSKKLSVPPEAIKIQSVEGNFGSHTFSVLAKVYDSAKSKEKIEVLTKQEKEGLRKAEEEKRKVAKEIKAKEKGE